MAKFVIVNQAPSEVDKNCLVIEQPTFMEQIEANHRKAPKSNQTAINHLREVLNSIADKYDHDMNVFRINLTNYVDIPYENDAQFSTILTRLLKDQYPAIFDKYLDFKIRSRPMNTKLVYYVGDLTSSTPFYSAGLDLIEEKDVADYLSGKPKRIVGRPAVSNKEVNNDSQ